MPDMRPMLGELELKRVQKIEVDGDQVLVQHSVPALEGDFWQRLERGAARIRLIGVVTDEEEIDKDLKTLREKYQEGVPVPFVADITSATQVGDVVIEEMGVRELAGKPFRYEYSFTLVEFTNVDPKKKEEPPPPKKDPIPDPLKAKLIVEVIVEGTPDFDFSTVTVTVQGTQENGSPLQRTMTNRRENSGIWEEDDFPAGKFTVTATTSVPQQLTGSTPAEVTLGQTTSVTIRLTPGVIAKKFIVHFWFDKSFIEPCLRPVLSEIADYAAAHKDEKMLILGHTDLTGSDDYNDFLSERRARSVFAYLTYKQDKPTSLAEWQDLRRNRPAGTTRTINDNWDVREYQHMLQDLGHYRGSVDEDNGPATRQAVRDFKAEKGITPVNDTMTDETWNKLIEAYLDTKPLSVTSDHLFDNCPGEKLKWLGCGEHDPVDNTKEAERRNRRTEVLFVKADKLPNSVAEPRSLKMPPERPVNNGWCLNLDSKGTQCTMVIPYRELDKASADDKRWRRVPVNPNQITVSVSITQPDGTPLTPPPEFVLIAPDGHYMTGEFTAPTEKRGRPQRKRVDAQGKFAFTEKSPVGTYIMQVPGFVVQAKGQPIEQAKGDFACKKIMADNTPFEVIVLPVASAGSGYQLQITVHDIFGEPLVNTDVEVWFDDASHISKVTDDLGRLLIDIQRPREMARIIYRYGDAPNEIVQLGQFYINVGDIGTDEGVRRRLSNLGYLIDENLGDAVITFQGSHGLNTTGEIDEDTRHKLQLVHDGSESISPKLELISSTFGNDELEGEWPP